MPYSTHQLRRVRSDLPARQPPHEAPALRRRDFGLIEQAGDLSQSLVFLVGKTHREHLVGYANRIFDSEASEKIPQDSLFFAGYKRLKGR
jgi:hypothetical protein